MPESPENPKKLEELMKSKGLKDFGGDGGNLHTHIQRTHELNEAEGENIEIHIHWGYHMAEGNGKNKHTYRWHVN
jgi:hypothetical protein